MLLFGFLGVLFYFFWLVEVFSLLDCLLQWKTQANWIGNWDPCISLPRKVLHRYPITGTVLCPSLRRCINLWISLSLRSFSLRQGSHGHSCLCMDLFRASLISVPQLQLQELLPALVPHEHSLQQCPFHSAVCIRAASLTFYSAFYSLFSCEFHDCEIWF